MASGVLLLADALFASSATAATPAVQLATTAPYSVLGGQTVTNIGPSTLSGDLGVSPGTAITGFPPGSAAGATHAADAPASQAQSDLTLAYDDAASRPLTASVAGDLVGTTEVSGVYKATGPLALSGTLTLDGQGDPNAVFIFQIASTLITSSASYVNLINGAQACNVFWQVGDSATLGTHSVFRGTILALTSITVTTGVLVQGRALARNGAVTLDDDTFTSPDCATGTATSTTPSTTTVSLSPTSTTPGAHTTITATVTAAGPAPTGTFTFSSGGVVLGTAPVDSTGQATLSIPTGTTVGTRIITAHYNGDIAHTPSTSGPATLTIHAVATPTRSAATGSTHGTTVRTAAAPSPTPATTSPVLAVTGPQHTGSLLTLAATLLTLGAAITWAARRRRALHRG